MKQFLDLSPSHRARVWLDESPPADFSATSVVTRVVRPNAPTTTCHRSVAIELNVNHGPRASYGLLGAELVVGETDGLEIVVSVNKLAFPFQHSLVLQPDEAKIGLDDEYVNAVVAGVTRVAESQGAPARASLRFRWAAHALVASSPAIFERLGALVVQLFTLPMHATDEQIRALLLASA